MSHNKSKAKKGSKNKKSSSSKKSPNKKTKSASSIFPSELYFHEKPEKWTKSNVIRYFPSSLLLSLLPAYLYFLIYDIRPLEFFPFEVKLIEMLVYFTSILGCVLLLTTAHIPIHCNHIHWLHCSSNNVKKAEKLLFDQRCRYYSMFYIQSSFVIVFLFTNFYIFNNTQILWYFISFHILCINIFECMLFLFFCILGDIHCHLCLVLELFDYGFIIIISRLEADERVCVL